MSFERVCQLAERQSNAKHEFLENNYYQATLLLGDFEIERDVRCCDGKAVLTVKTMKAMIWGGED